MPIKVITEEPKVKSVLWHNVIQGEVYRGDGLLVLAVSAGSLDQPARAVALEVSDAHTVTIGSVWSPGKMSEWWPMQATLSVVPAP